MRHAAQCIQKRAGLDSGRYHGATPVAGIPGRAGLFHRLFGHLRKTSYLFGAAIAPAIGRGTAPHEAKA
jgi:hypothetical protein